MADYELSEITASDHFIVCGLGSLGQHCVVALKKFGVSVTAIEQIEPRQWDIPHLPSLLTDLVTGDCRDSEILEAAKIDQCRALLIVTSNEQINAETAVAARSRSPHTRLVIRSGQENLNQLLGEHLGNFIAFEPTQLSADAFALAALGTETQGLFYLDAGEKKEQQLFRVIKCQIEPTDKWCNQRTLQELNTQRRPSIPKENHIVIIGIRRLGKKVAQLLLDLKQNLLGIPLNSEFNTNTLPEMPMIFGTLKESLQDANLEGAKSVIVGTEDEMLNLEISLTIHRINPDCQLVIRTFEQRLSENLSQLLPQAVVLCAYSVAAEAFAGAAFGENIIKLFRLNQQTVLVTEYAIEETDTLHRLLLADVAYGYNVVPILHQKEGQIVKFMPSDDIRLTVRDRLVVLATMEGLKRVEVGQLDTTGKTCQVQVESARTSDALFEGGNTLVRITGCSINEAREMMSHLPIIVPTLLYYHQAKRLIRELKKVQVKASIVKN